MFYIQLVQEARHKVRKSIKRKWAMAMETLTYTCSVLEAASWEINVLFL